MGPKPHRQTVGEPELIRRLARTAGIPAADRLSSHSLRHSAISLGTPTPAPPDGTTAPDTTSTGTPPTHWPAASAAEPTTEPMKDITGNRSTDDQ